MSEASKVRARYKVITNKNQAYVVSSVNNKVVLVARNEETAQAYINNIIRFPFTGERLD